MDTIDFQANLGLVAITADEILKHVTEAIVLGSKRNQLSWSDFTFMSNAATNVTVDSPLQELIDAGVPYLDAVVLKSASTRPAGIVISERTVAENKQVNYLDISRGLFAWYFSLYSQGRAVGAGKNNFLGHILNLGGDWPSLVNALTSANIENFPKGWVKNVEIGRLDEAARNRLALGAGGQRFLQALNYISEDDFLEGKDEEKNFVAVLRTWTSSKVYWDLHPLFKSGNVITVTKSLNKSIEDCLAHGLKETSKAKLADARILHRKPIEQPAHAQWRTLKPESLPKLAYPIF